MTSRAAIDTAVLDIDGTLLDSVYAHVWSWREAFRVVGIAVPAYQIHRAIGMGGDRLVEAVTGPPVERSVGDEIRALQSELYADMSTHLTPTPGAGDLLEALKSRGLHVVLASSGSRDDTEKALDVLETRSCVDATVSGDDADATKPDSEPVRRAVDVIGGRRAVVVGDAVWDVESARRSGYPAWGVLTGGVARSDLLDAGAAAVFEDPAGVADGLDAALLDLEARGPRS